MNNLIQTLEMFVILAIELTILFLVISYLVGVLQFYLPPEKIKHVLSDKNGRGYVTASLLGAITPFCSCSTIPFLKGLLRANAGFGTMMVFLFASPLLNPIIISLLVFTFGWQVAIFYFAIALSVSIIGGITLEKLGFAKYIKPVAFEAPQTANCANGCSGEAQTAPSKWKVIWRSTWKDFKKVLPYLLIGITLGAFIYGYVPTEWIASMTNDENPLAIPIAAVIGIPLYVRAEVVIPLSAALVGKGMSLAAILALIIGSAGASLTEVILLRSIFKTKIIIAFLVVILSMAIGAGFLYRFLF